MPSSCSGRASRMNSFISSFRPLLLAAVTIACIETAIAMTVQPSLVERSNYLNWTFARSEPLHKFVVHQKLNEVLSTKPDVVRVGDSTGFGRRIVRLLLREASGTTYGFSRCHSKAGRAYRERFYDAGIAVTPDGSIVCWGIIQLTQDRAVVGVHPWPQNTEVAYRGDGQSGLIIQEFALFMRSSPDVVIDLNTSR